MVDEANVNSNKGRSDLIAYVERIERVNGEISELQEDRKEIFAEAKASGFDVKVMRAVVQRRKQDRDKRDDFDAKLALYEGIFG